MTTRISNNMVCSSKIERQYYKLQIDFPVVCYMCGMKLEEDGILKFQKLRTQYKVVLPACDAEDCTAKPNMGGICSSPTKRGVKDSKRAKRDAKVAGKRNASALSIDLKTFKIRPIGSDFDGWLADSKRVWDQHRYQMIARRRMKKQRKSTER